MDNQTIDFAISELMSLSRAARLLPTRRNGRPTNPSTLFRWATKGQEGIVLKTWRLGSSIVTTERALREFIQASTEARRVRPDDPVPRESTDRVLRKARIVESADDGGQP